MHEAYTPKGVKIGVSTHNHLLRDGIIQLVSHPSLTISDKDAFLAFIIELSPSCIWDLCICHTTKDS
jgi:hypothetical protein